MNSQLPEVLFHYTGQHGLIGIAQERAIWASRIDFLNDKSELEHALELVRDQLQIAAAGCGEHLANALKATENAVCLPRAMDGHRMFRWNVPHVASLSENGDLLSQWRGYCGGGSGFSIGFSRERLAHVLSANGAELAPVIYHDSQKNDLIAKAVGDLVRELSAAIGSEELPSPDQMAATNKLISGFIKSTSEFAPLFKDKAFAEEREWRIIVRDVVKLGFDNAKFRIGRPGPVPYISVSLLENEAQNNRITMPIQSVILSPSTEHVVHIAVMGILSPIISTGFSVGPSAIPLRKIE